MPGRNYISAIIETMLKTGCNRYEKKRGGKNISFDHFTILAGPERKMTQSGED